MFSKENKKGQILEEGVNEAGVMSSFIAAGTSYSSNNQPIRRRHQVSGTPRTADGSGTILRGVREAAKILREEFNVGAEVWSATSFNKLRRDGLVVGNCLLNKFASGSRPGNSRYWALTVVVLAALEALNNRVEIEPKAVFNAIVKFGTNLEKPNPLDC